MVRLRRIAQIGHPILRQPAKQVTMGELQGAQIQDLIDDLVATMRDANGAGLAAPQIYEPVQICAIEVGDNPRYPYKPKIPLTILINPKLTPLDTQQFENLEGCLSVPNLRGRVMRHAHMGVEAMDRNGETLSFEVKGITAGTFQHEVDHLHGTLFVDRLVNSHSLSTWENFERYQQEPFIKEVHDIVEKWGA